MKAKYTIFDNFSNWVEGTVDGHIFEAELDDFPNERGINKGRVISLIIYGDKKNKQKGNIISYHKKWELPPVEKTRPYYETVMTLLENSPKRFKDEGFDPKTLNLGGQLNKKYTLKGLFTK